MKRLWMGCFGLALALAAKDALAQEMQWRPIGAPTELGVTLVPPEPHKSPDGQKANLAVAAHRPETGATHVVRAQGLDPTLGPPTFGAIPPPPPPPRGFAGSAPSDENYNCAVKAHSSGGAGFWDQARDGIVGIPQTFGQAFNGVQSRAFLQSDHCFDYFCSPITNPFYFEDPRSLTELRPLLIYQPVPGSNYAFKGGDIWFYGVQGRLAFTDIFSLVISKLGAITLNPQDETSGITNSTGFAEVMLGPKFTFIRSESTRTLVAAGLIFDLAVGNKSVFQNTGDLSLVPYISFGQSFGESNYGRFNFLNTTGYSLGVDSQRTDFFYSSFHLDYDVGKLNKIFPLIELNWFTYTQNGGSPSFFGFEGRDLVNFGSGGVAGHHDLSMALGARYKFAEWLQLGLAAEFPLLSDKDLMSYRIGFDLIFRY